MQLTTLGRGILVAGAAVLAAGVGLGLVAACVVGAFMVSLVGCAVLVVAEVPRVHLARAAHPADVERGGPAEIRLAFRSTSTKRSRPLTVIERLDGVPRVATIGPIAPEGIARLHYAIATTRRGIVRAGPLVLRRSDPFGLVTADRRFTSTTTVSVRPRRYPLRMLPSGRRRDLEGPTRERSDGSASFHQLREYTPGDDLRRIHWRTTARTGELLVKQMVDTTKPELVLVLDNREAAITPDDFEHAVDITASIQAAAETEDFPTILMFAGGTGVQRLDATPDSGEGPPIPAIDRLTAVHLDTDDSLTQLADVLAARGRSLVFVTGEPSGADLATLAKLARGFTPAYLVSVVADRTAPVVAPRGMRAIACSDGADFVANWSSLR